MNVWNLLQPWSNVIVPMLLHFLWQGALIAVLAAVMRIVFRRSSPSMRYAASLGLFTVMAVAPLVTATLLFSGVSLAPPVSLSSGEMPTPAPLHWQSPWYTEDGPHALINTVTAWQPFVLITWLIGVAICSLRLTGGLIWYGWLSRRFEPIPQELTAVVRRLSQRLGVTTSVRVMLSRDVREPLAMRIIRPLIVLPASWLLNAPPLVVEAVLAHELAHIRRHDLWVNLLQRVVETLFFFHPAVWWLSRLIRQERELCCDALAVAATGRAVEYAQALEAVARFRLAWSSPAMAAGMGGDRMALLDRVRRVLGLETASDAGWWPVGLAGLLLAAACGTGMVLTSGVVQGDEDQAVAQAEEKKEDPPRRDEERPRPPRDGERRPEERPRDGERRPEERPRDGDRRPVERPRDGERRPDAGPRDGDRRPEERPRDGDRGPQPPRFSDRPREGERGPQPEGDVMRELLMTIRELRQEVQMLREEMRSMRGPGDRGRLIDGPRGGDEFRPRGDAPGRGSGPDARGPQPGRDDLREPGPRPVGPPRGELPRGERRPEGRGEESPPPPRRPEADPKDTPKT